MELLFRTGQEYKIFVPNALFNPLKINNKAVNYPCGYNRKGFVTEPLSRNAVHPKIESITELFPLRLTNCVYRNNCYAKQTTSHYQNSSWIVKF